ncbi:MAG: sugar-binding domain-containing protein [Halapricum sp.]
MSNGSADVRRSITLDGDWTFVTDPNETGIEDGWMHTDATWPDRARAITVPKAWEELDDLRTYTGTAWYRREVVVDRVGDRNVVIRFGAVDYETTVWVNGQRVGENRGGYVPFEFDVTDELRTGINTITVAVTDPADLREIPHGKQGDPWYTRVSGIWQSVSLDFRPRTRVTNLEVTPELMTDTATVALTLKAGPRELSALECVVKATREGEVVAEATTEGGEHTEVTLDFDDPEYWSPDAPALYDLEVVLRDGTTLLDQTTDYFGMRSFDTDGEQFFLNGEPITLRGVLEQGYYPKTLYRPSEPDTFADEVSVAKELGFNLIRKHVKPAHPEFLECADRQGLLVWEEPANPTVYTDRSRSEVVDQMRGTINRDYNRPSVVIWSLYNEEWGIGHADNEETLWVDEEKQRFLADQYRAIRERDPTRLVCDNSGWAHITTDINDFHRYFVSPDRADAWEQDLDYIRHHPRDNYATSDFEDTDAPIVISELGTWGLDDLSGLRADYAGDPPWFDHAFLTEAHKRPDGVDQRFTETDMSTVFDDYDALADAWQRRQYISVKHLLEAVRTRESIAGYVLTELSDIEWEFNGVLDYRREPKNFYDEFAAVNDAVAVVADLDSHVLRAGDSLVGDVAVVNDLNRELEGTVSWTLDWQTGTFDLTVEPNSVAIVEGSVNAAVGTDGTVRSLELDVRFESEEWTSATREPITCVNLADREPPTGTVLAEGRLASALARDGVDVTHQIDRADVVITPRITEAIDSFAAGSGDVVQIPESDGTMSAGGPFDFYQVPERESWVGAASFFYQDSPLFAGISDRQLGWELEDMYPSAVATGLAADDDIHAGYVEGWLANWSSPLVTRPVGDGTVTALAFDVPGEYGDQPVATLLCYRLLEYLAET